MKKHTSNGAATRTAETHTITPSLKQLVRETDRFVDECYELKEQGVDLAERFVSIEYPERDLPERVRIMIAEQKAENTTVKAELEVPVWVYGHLCAAAAIHGKADWKEMLLEYLRCTVSEWSNTGYYIDP